MADIPSICISIAPQPEPIVEPTSPFTWTPSPSSDDGFRATYLAPSPGLSPALSPLRPLDTLGSGKGLERERFEALLRASKERNVSVGAKKTRDLRKEIALKAHKTKQVERRALFLSKVHAPPSPGATSTPKTPPESPAIFHYSLPSPGLESPLALFEAISLGGDESSGVQWVAREPWVEQVDFRMPLDRQLVNKIQAKAGITRSAHASKPGKPLPSLAEIAARVSSRATGPVVTIANPPRATPRLPAFLSAKRAQVVAATPQIVVVAPEPAAAPQPRSRLPIGALGRLQMPIRAAPAPAVPVVIAAPKPVQKYSAPPGSPLMPKLEITTTVVPRTCQTSPTELSRQNLEQLCINSAKKVDQRARTRKDLISTLQRRNVIQSSETGHVNMMEDTMAERRARRISAPAEMQPRERLGFAHPVLSKPGGF